MVWKGLSKSILTQFAQNAEVLARWLGDAKFYISRYRPVPVEEHLVFDNAVYPASSSRMFYKTATQLNHSQSRSNSQCQAPSSTQLKPALSRTIQPSPDKELGDPLINSVVSLANETARAGYGALVFCSSRNGCERDALLISLVLPGPAEVDPETMDLRYDLLNDLRNTSSGLDQTLEKTIPVGVAYHRKCWLACTSEEMLIFS